MRTQACISALLVLSTAGCVGAVPAEVGVELRGEQQLRLRFEGPPERADELADALQQALFPAESPIAADTSVTIIDAAGRHTAPLAPGADLGGLTALAEAHGFALAERGTATASASATGKADLRVAPWTRRARLAMQADYNGDGLADPAIYRASTDELWVHNQARSTFSFQPLLWPLLGDYDGNGATDRAYFWPRFGEWWLPIAAEPGNYDIVTWGEPGDIPVPGDYDGNGATDPAIFRPSTNTFWVNYRNGSTRSLQLGFGVGVIPVVGDYDGDGSSDFAVYAQGVWSVRTSAGAPLQFVLFGRPVPGDYDGDGKSDPAVFTSGGVWRVQESKRGYAPAPDSTWGYGSSDVPIQGDFDGDNTADYVVWRPSTGTWWMKFLSGATRSVAWGAAGDQPLGGPRVIADPVQL